MVDKKITTIWLILLGLSLLLWANSNGLLAYLGEYYAIVIGFGSTLFYLTYILLTYLHKHNNRAFKIVLPLVIILCWGLYFYWNS